MSIHLARHNASTAMGPPNFVARNIPFMSPAPISSLAIGGFAQIKELAYDGYQANIDAFLYATFAKKKVIVAGSAFGDIYLPEHILPFPIPPLAFTPIVNFTRDEDISAFMDKLGKDATYNMRGKWMEVVHVKPSPAKAPIYRKIANLNQLPSDSAFVSPIGYLAYCKVITILELFLQTQTYPAFSSNLDRPEYPSYDMGIALKEKQYIYSKEADNTEGEFSARKRRRIMEIGGGDIMEVDESTQEIDAMNKVQGMLFKGIQDAVMTAKPSPGKAENNFGGIGGVPNLPGLAFPYFHGMVQPDSLLFKMAMFRFIRLFGGSLESASAEYKELRRGFQNLATTDVGLALSHAIKGMELALETQTRLYLIFNNREYQGFTLLGAKFQIFDSTKWHFARSPEELRDDLSAMDSHSLALKNIAEILSRTTIHGTSRKQEIDPARLTSAKRISELLVQRELVGDDSELMNRSLSRLVWNTPYRQINKDTLVELFQHLDLEDKTVPDDNTPFFIPRWDAPLKDRRFLWLATFGPDSPSIWDARGDVISLSVSGKGKKRAAETSSDIPKAVVITPKPVLVAFRDWTEQVIKKKAVSMNMKERARGYRTHVFKSNGAVEELWNALVKASGSWSQESEAGSSRRVAQIPDTAIVTVDNILDLL